MRSSYRQLVLTIEGMSVDLDHERRRAETAEQSLSTMRAALEAEAFARRVANEHYRQFDNAWKPSPGWGRVGYDVVWRARRDADRLRAEILGPDKIDPVLDHEGVKVKEWWLTVPPAALSTSAGGEG